MKKSCQIAMLTAAAVLSAALLVAPIPGRGQSPEDEKAKAKAAAKAKQIALITEQNSRVLNLFDREGKIVGTVGERGLYGLPVLSPDRTRVAVTKNDLNAENTDLWVLDVATGKETRITTTTGSREGPQSPAWSPDGSQLAYISLRAGIYGLYRKASNGQGPEELLYQLPGVGTLTDWSMDGRFLTYFTTDLGGGIVYVVPATGQDHKAIEVFRSTFQTQGARLSPDSRFLSYMSTQSGRREVYVRPFNPANPAAPASLGPWQMSDQGAQGMAYWRNDGKEFYYLSLDRAIMAVEISTTPAFEFGKPKVLFRPSETLQFNVGHTNVSRDGQRLLISLPTASQLRQITVFDRQGKVVAKVGEPGLYGLPGLSPDGTRVVSMWNDLKTGQSDIWTFDVATGKGTRVTNDVESDNTPVFSPDGKQVAYVSTRKNYSSIYRKAWDGTGNEEQLFQYTPGAGVALTDWSADGKFMTFFTGVLLVVPLSGDQKPTDRKAIDWLRDEYTYMMGRFSPDMRYMAYMSDEAEAQKMEVYVRPFDASKPETAPAGPVVRVSREGAMGTIGWRGDGKELYFMQADPKTTDVFMMVADVTTTPAFQAGTPRVLFKLPSPITSQWKNVSSDGQRFVFTVNVPVGAPAR